MLRNLYYTARVPYTAREPYIPPGCRIPSRGQSGIPSPEQSGILSPEVSGIPAEVSGIPREPVYPGPERVYRGRRGCTTRVERRRVPSTPPSIYH